MIVQIPDHALKKKLSDIRYFSCLSIAAEPGEATLARFSLNQQIHYANTLCSISANIYANRHFLYEIRIDQ